MRMKYVHWALSIAALSLLAPLPVSASPHGDVGRALIETVLQGGMEALQNDKATPSGKTPSSAESTSNVPNLKSIPAGMLLDSLGVDAWKQQAEKELSDYVSKLADKATASIVKRLDRDGEIRAGIQENIYSVRLLCWILLIYLFGISPFMFVLLASNHRIKKQLQLLNEKLDAAGK